MTNGSGEKAKRIVLELPDKRDGGGRCESSVIDCIIEGLESEGVIV